MTRMAVWRPRLEFVALALVTARFVDFGADITSAVSWESGTVGDWFSGLSAFPAVARALVLLVPLVILVVTRVLYSWPKETPVRVASIAAAGAWLLGAAGVIASVGCAVTQLARMGSAAAHGSTAPFFLAGAFYALGGLMMYSVAVILSTWLLGELRRDRPARPARKLIEPESGPRR